MRRVLAALFLAFVVAALVFLPARRSDRPASVLDRVPAENGLQDDPDAQAEMEFLMLRDPRTDEIPRGIRRREQVFARGLPRRDSRSPRLAAGRTMSPLVWTERGPNNVGGRTRAFAIDVTNASTLIAGSVAGGMWKSTDDGASWSPRTAPGQLHGMTCVTQDRRSGKTAIWYAGTGEIRGSTTNDTRWGSLYRGDGIFKSTDDGDSWTLLPSTSSGTPQVSDAFDFVTSVATNPANLGQDEVLAATHLGIYRSTDGGGAWTRVLASDSGYTDVAITPQGVMYAAIRNGSALRVMRSTNGTTWALISPGSFPTAAGRIVFGLAPSNPQVVYVFVQGVNTAPQANGHQLWKYVYVSGDGSGAGGTWANRGGSLPVDINTQGGYDMVIHVRPGDENFVIVGGTDLFRSTNGFATNATTVVIGGYAFWPYAFHHPDLHGGGFSPANDGIYYSAGDGGIAKAHDITLADMEWESLNHGYNVTQFYSVSIAPDAGSDRILAGAQDNGSQMGDAPGASDWVMAFGGDGTIVEVSPAISDRLYTQYQGGQMQRQTWSGADLADITPGDAANQLFVNPIALDPNDPARLYYAGGTISEGGSRIWRNDSAPIADNSFGWSNLPATDVGNGGDHVRRISTIGLSTANAANVLYLGTMDGVAFRVDDAHTATPTVTNISPPGLNAGARSGGFVRCIAVDPTNSSRALLAFGNYNFPSLWYTTNGGATWTDVEGNLAGAAGPSVRWATMVDLDGTIEIFIGTSIGLLSTTALNGASTVWTQEATSEIGNVLIATMDYRPSDRTLAVGTHARGVFTTQFAPPVAVEDDVAPARVALEAPFPNPVSRTATIAYRLPRASDVSLKLYDVSGRTALTVVHSREDAGRHQVQIPTQQLRAGTYFAVLRADGRRETRSLTVTR